MVAQKELVTASITEKKRDVKKKKERKHCASSSASNASAKLAEDLKTILPVLVGNECMKRTHRHTNVKQTRLT